jgi:rhodanese-related sulfurtransferase
VAGSKHKLAVSLIALAASLGAAAQVAPAADRVSIVNPAIDSPAYLRAAHRALAHRDRHRLSEAQFIRMSRQPGTVVLDARSKAKFDELHVAGAIHLDFPDMAVESLATLLPDRNVRILIYCNNNFRGARSAFPTKLPSASLNLSTYIALYSYGYRNVWELGPLIDLDKSAIAFARTPTASP